MHASKCLQRAQPPRCRSTSARRHSAVLIPHSASPLPQNQRSVHACLATLCEVEWISHTTTARWWRQRAQQPHTKTKATRRPIDEQPRTKRRTKRRSDEATKRRSDEATKRRSNDEATKTKRRTTTKFEVSRRPGWLVGWLVDRQCVDADDRRLQRIDSFHPFDRAEFMGVTATTRAVRNRKWVSACVVVGGRRHHLRLSGAHSLIHSLTHSLTHSQRVVVVH